MRPVPALLPFSWLYALVVVIRNLFFDWKIFRTERVDAPVISVGNLVAGGTGKTPFVELIAGLLHHKNIRTAVVSRGYKRRSKGLVEVADGSALKANVGEAGDEAFQLAIKLPGISVVVDDQRVRGARHAVQELHAEAIILDDGFQHRALHRDLDIVLIDNTRSLFTTAMIPAGERRETLSSLKRADAVVLTRVKPGTDVSLTEQSVRRYSGAKVFSSSVAVRAFRRAKTKFSLDLASVLGKHAVAFCAIARPENFAESLGEIGIRVDGMISFGDHHWYTEADLQRVKQEHEKFKSDYIVTTEKDVVRLSSFEFFETSPLFYLEIGIEMNGSEEWDQLIGSVLSKRRSHENRDYKE